MTSNRIFLVGFMGSGKSSIGKKLARLLHFDFFDTDAEIERKTDKSISQIFETEGETFFREQERTLITELVQKNNIVVSTGGGLPCFFDNMQQMKQAGLTIYFRAMPNMLKQRIINSKNKRPLLDNLSDEELTAHIAQLLHQRESDYRQSHLIVEAFNLTPQKLLWIIRLKYPEIISPL